MYSFLISHAATLHKAGTVFSRARVQVFVCKQGNSYNVRDMVMNFSQCHHVMAWLKISSFKMTSKVQRSKSMRCVRKLFLFHIYAANQ